MGKILDFISKETDGSCFTSYKHSYDDAGIPSIEYEAQEDTYINLKEYAEDIKDPKPRDLTQRAQICMQGPPLFKFFLDGSRKVYKLDDIQYDRKVYPIVGGQISVACCGRDSDENGHYVGFHKIEETFLNSNKKLKEINFMILMEMNIMIYFKRVVLLS